MHWGTQSSQNHFYSFILLSQIAVYMPVFEQAEKHAVLPLTNDFVWKTQSKRFLYICQMALLVAQRHIYSYRYYFCSPYNQRDTSQCNGLQWCFEYDRIRHVVMQWMQNLNVRYFSELELSILNCQINSVKSIINATYSKRNDSQKNEAFPQKSPAVILIIR